MKRLLFLSMTTLLLATGTAGYAQNAPAKKKTATPVGASSTTTTKSKTTTTSTPANDKPVATVTATKPATAAASNTGKTASENQFSFGVNLEPALPLGNLKLISSFGFGVNVMGKYSLSDKLALKGSLGYMTFIGKTYTETEDDGNGNIQTVSFKAPAAHAVTLRAGASYMLTDNIFAQGSIGLAFLNHGGGTAFLYTPGIGYTSGHVELLLKYEGWSANGGTLSFLGLQVGYMF